MLRLGIIALSIMPAITNRRLVYNTRQKGVSGSGTTSYSWFVWDRQRKNEGTELLWIEPGFKE